VFIHGIQVHPRDTWTYTNQDASDSSKATKKASLLRRMLGKNVKAQDGQSGAAVGSGAEAQRDQFEGVFWPEDLLPVKFRQCRILTFGYDSHVSHFFKGPANQNSLMQHGSDLLNRLEAARRDEPGNLIVDVAPVSKRKIIFLAHSLGGLIVKEVSSNAATKF
jgi:hypothetical protein